MMNHAALDSVYGEVFGVVFEAWFFFAREKHSRSTTVSSESITYGSYASIEALMSARALPLRSFSIFLRRWRVRPRGHVTELACPSNDVFSVCSTCGFHSVLN